VSLVVFLGKITKNARDFAPGNPAGCSNLTSIAQNKYQAKRFTHCYHEDHKAGRTKKHIYNIKGR